ncbi:MFS transporter [Nocardia veterana]|uniref:MFS transporter n=1 Tax=Nocardia veterana TaxID=132249 RepID=UPI00031170F7|nr:MFS transporter [Nocardia veterana]
MLTDLLSWRWIFLVNLPIAAVAIVLSLSAFGPAQRRPDRSVDVAGMVAFAGAATAITYGIVRGGEYGWGDGATLASLAVGALAAVGFVVIETRSTAPMFPLALLRNREFGATLIAAAGFNFAAFATSPLISLWLQQQLHLSPLQAGLSMLPMALTAFLVSAVFGRRLHDAAPRWTIGGGLLIIGAGAGLLGLIDTGSSWSALLFGYVVLGIGIGVLAPPLVAVAMAAVSPQQSGTAAGAVNTARQLGLALGVAVLGTVFRGTAGEGRITVAQFVSGLDAAVAVAAGVGILGGVVAFALLRGRSEAAPVEPVTAEVTVG